VPDAPVALITGASRGIGRSVALRLARDGFAIGGCYAARAEDARATERDVRATGADCRLFECDIRDAAAVDRLVSEVQCELGPITALVNNAGIVRDNPIVLMPPEDWQAVIETNLTGTFNVCRAVVFQLMKRRCGTVVNMSSIAGIQGNASQSNYAATKAGIIGASRSLAKELAPLGIRVNVVAPGFIDTEMTGALAEKLREQASTAAWSSSA
jgi:3-oxoacyl-[acyl-carrier protein] reductase